MNTKIAERIAKCNKGHCAKCKMQQRTLCQMQNATKHTVRNAKLIKSKFCTKNTQMKTHKTMIRPAVTYWSETWTLTAKDEHNRGISRRQILRKIFGAVNIDSMRTRNNTETDTLTEGADIVRFIKAQRIKWLGHIQRMGQARPTRKLLEWKPMGIRPIGLPRQRWQEGVMEDLKKDES